MALARRVKARTKRTRRQLAQSIMSRLGMFPRCVLIILASELTGFVYSKSKLRQKEAPTLGPKYSGVRVSRAALDDSDGEHNPADSEDDQDGSESDSEEYDDPETADLERDNIIDDEEIESDNALGKGEEEMFRKKGFTFRDSKTVTNGRRRRPVAADFMSGSETDGEGAGSDAEDALERSSHLDGSESEDSDENDSSEDDEGSEEDSGEDEEMGDSGTDQPDSHSDLRKLMKTDQKAVVATISQAAKEDAQKGLAVRQQRRAYDSLLNLRIRLQKGLVAVNSLPEVSSASSDGKQQTPYQAAEQAALKLWTAIDGFRASLLPESTHKAAGAGTKRKRDFDVGASNDEIWAAMQETEEQAAVKRKKVLDKWSARVKNSTATVSKARQLSTTQSQSLVAVLENQLLTSTDRLVGRTRVPRSCAPVQAARKASEDAHVFDDADFYQLLLKELVDQRSGDASAGAGAEGSVPTVRWTAIREAKTRKQVDRRASKGRKLRFTVHEKLQNFMALEDRRAWEEDAIDRLFGTLFGQRIGLKEDVEEEEADEMDVAEEGLKLFRS